MIASSLVLAIDTCSAVAGAALADASGILGERYLGRERVRAESVGALLPQLLAEAGAEASDIRGFGVINGPGSYTGLRVGLALARGLALLDGLQVAAISSLELAAVSVDVAEGDVCVVLDAGRGRFYSAGYRKSAGGVVAETLATAVSTAEELSLRFSAERQPWILCHECGSAAVADLGGGYAEFARQRAGVLASWALGALDEGRGQPSESVLPVYAGSLRFRHNPGKVLVGPDPSR